MCARDGTWSGVIRSPPLANSHGPTSLCSMLLAYSSGVQVPFEASPRTLASYEKALKGLFSARPHGRDWNYISNWGAAVLGRLELLPSGIRDAPEVNGLAARLLQRFSMIHICRGVGKHNIELLRLAERDSRILPAAIGGNDVACAEVCFRRLRELVGAGKIAAPVDVVHDINHIDVRREIAAVRERLSRDEADGLEAEFFSDPVRSADTVFGRADIDDPLRRVELLEILLDMGEYHILVFILKCRVTEERIDLLPERLDLAY